MITADVDPRAQEGAMQLCTVLDPNVDLGLGFAVENLVREGPLVDCCL